MCIAKHSCRASVPIHPQNLLATTLRNAFAATANHRLPRDQLAASKKWGALAVVCVLFRMYFKLNQLRQAKFLIGAVEGPGFPPLEEFPVAQVRGRRRSAAAPSAGRTTCCIWSDGRRHCARWVAPSSL